MTVWNTIANMKALDASLGSFFKVLKCEIGNQNCWRLRDAEEVSCSQTPNQWCWYTSYVRYGLRRIPRGEEFPRGPGNLTVGVELWREVMDRDDPWEHEKQPLIYIGFCPNRNDWWAEDMALDYLGLPASYPDGEVNSPTEEVPYLWTWNGEGENRWSRRNWFFVLPLCTIGRREDIENEIMAPLRSLLVDNSDPNTAFDGRQAIR